MNTTSSWTECGASSGLSEFPTLFRKTEHRPLYRTLTEELVQTRADLEALQRRGPSAEPNQPDEISRSTAFFKDEMDSLRGKIEQAQMKIHDLEQEVLEVSSMIRHRVPLEVSCLTFLLRLSRRHMRIKRNWTTFEGSRLRGRAPYWLD